MMKASFLTENLGNYLSLLGKVIPSHSQIPTLTSILLETTQEGMSLSVTDLEFGVKVTIPAKTEEEGGTLIPGRQFIEIISSLTHEKANISQEKEQTVVVCPTGTFKLQSIPKEEFPKLFEEKGEKKVGLSSKTFEDIFGKLLFAVSTDEGRPHLTGVYMVKTEKGADFVATDGYRMSLKQMPQENLLGGLFQGIILSQRLVQEALSLKTTEDISLYVQDGASQAIIETGGAVLVGRLIEGTYPDYHRVIPESSKTSITIDREEFQRLLKVVSVFARENANVVSFYIEKGTLRIKVAESSLGEAESVLDGTQEGEDNSISFNIKFVMDFLRSITSKTVVLKVNSATEPAQFSIPEDPNFLHIIMPVKVQD